ncbi:MAG: glycosyltransferase [Chitinophagaceae bacterium]|nr:glycosyltransferase [Chitinophagaceae bacterium]
MNRHLHIICLDAPYPADYGGAIDMFYKIEALYKAGIKIHLHYFSYNDRKKKGELNQYCESINAYDRKTGWEGFSFKLPYIISSRINIELAHNINKDDHPVLLEGLHCTGILSTINKNKKIVVRMHNIESDYYKCLESSTNDLSKKIYYRRESRLLKKYQHSLPKDHLYACITEKDKDALRKEYGLKNSFFLPAFTPFHEINGQEGMGNFCLYHGNLSVPENEKAALWLLHHVFSKIKIPLVIAGKAPSDRLKKIAQLYQHICLVVDPPAKEINDLIRKAHINILPSFSTSGIKLKLLHALFEGRHCVVNNDMVAGTGLESACHIGANANAIASIITQLHHQPFTPEEILLRKKLLGTVYDTAKNADQLIQHLY